MSLTGSNWFSVDRCNYDTTKGGRLDSPLGAACCCLLSNKRRFMDLMGRRNEGKILLLFFYNQPIKISKQANIHNSILSI